MWHTKTLFSSSPSFLPSSHQIRIDSKLSWAFKLIDKWELGTCKHFTHPFASHHPGCHNLKHPPTILAHHLFFLLLLTFFFPLFVKREGQKKKIQREIFYSTKGSYFHAQFSTKHSVTVRIGAVFFLLMFLEKGASALLWEGTRPTYV